jgi:hypothetical protein
MWCTEPMKNSKGKRESERVMRVCEEGRIQSHSKPIMMEISEEYFLRSRMASVK